MIILRHEKNWNVLPVVFKIPESKKLKERNLRRINFKRHNYFMLFRKEDDKAVVVEIFHGLEDYENKLD